MEGLPDQTLEALLEDTLWHERKRLERAKADEPERDHLDSLARSLVRGSRDERVDAGSRLVSDWGDEITAGSIPKVYRAATRVLPRALTALLSGRPRGWQARDLLPGRPTAARRPRTTAWW